MSRFALRSAAAALSLVLASCASEGPSYSADPPVVLGGDRPVSIVRPFDYDPSHAYPLVLVLHGYQVNGYAGDIVFGTSTLSDEMQFVLAFPDGTKNSSGKRFWNATDACCDFEHSGVDDVGYLTALVDEIEASYHIDRRRVVILGHSNGGTMGYRMICEHPERFTALVSLAGATYVDPTDCPPPAEPVSVLQVHGTADDMVLYEGLGDPLMPTRDYPSASEVVSRFASRLGCETSMATGGPDLDFDQSLAGAETHTLSYLAGCAPGSEAALYTMENGSHVPDFTDEGRRTMLTWALGHPR